MNALNNPYACHRYPGEIISHAVWLYFRFALSFRDIEELLAARGIGVLNSVRGSLKKFETASLAPGIRGFLMRCL